MGLHYKIRRDIEDVYKQIRQTLHNYDFIGKALNRLHSQSCLLWLGAFRGLIGGIGQDRKVHLGLAEGRVTLVKDQDLPNDCGGAF